MRQETEKEHFLKLTLAVYKVTELFPEEGESLKAQIRESADRVLADLIYSENGSRHIGKLKEFLGLAKEKNWVDSRNFLVLEKEYGKIRQLSKPEKAIVNNQRQGKILGILRSNRRIKVGDLLQTFPQVSRRTLIRDLEELFHSGMVARRGNGRGIEYSVRSST